MVVVVIVDIIVAGAVIVAAAAVVVVNVVLIIAVNFINITVIVVALIAANTVVAALAAVIVISVVVVAVVADIVVIVVIVVVVVVVPVVFSMERVKAKKGQTGAIKNQREAIQSSFHSFFPVLNFSGKREKEVLTSSFEAQLKFLLNKRTSSFNLCCFLLYHNVLTKHCSSITKINIFDCCQKITHAGSKPRNL